MLRMKTATLTLHIPYEGADCECCVFFVSSSLCEEKGLLPLSFLLSLPLPVSPLFWLFGISFIKRGQGSV